MQAEQQNIVLGPDSGPSKPIPNLLSILSDILTNVKRRTESKRAGRDYLAGAIERYKRGNMTLVLGAGASAERGILTWNTLLQELLLESIESNQRETPAQSRVLAWAFQSIFKPDALVAARYLNSFFAKKYPQDPLAFNEQVRKNLYRGLKEGDGEGLLGEIRKLCMAVGKSPNLREVITYNFDELLEEELKARGEGIKFASIYEEGKRPGEMELPIYHVHGFLPKEGELTSANQVIFSEEVYHRQYADVYHWSNLVQINAFRESSCLFVGTSLTDPNQRRLLDIAMKLRGDEEIHHYCIRKRYSQKDVESTLMLELERQPELKKAKIDSQLGEKEAIRHLIQITENYEEKDAASFGVGLIWVNTFEEYTEVIRRIRLDNPDPMPPRPFELQQHAPTPRPASGPRGRRSRKRNPPKKD